MNELERRRVALEATLAKYRTRPLDYIHADCVRMIRFHLLQMGHKPPALPRYRSAVGALRAVTKAGGLIAAFDAILPRIPHSRMLPGDIAVIEGDGMDCGVICLGHKVFGWHEAAEHPVNMELLEIAAAWRV